jgi:hypothetical protein
MRNTIAYMVARYWGGDCCRDDSGNVHPAQAYVSKTVVARRRRSRTSGHSRKFLMVNDFGPAS